MKIINELGFQGDIAFLKVDTHIEKAFEKLHGVSIKSIVSDASKRISHALKGDGVLAAGLHPEKGMVLAQGESRAHYHAFRNPDAVEVYPVNDNMRLIVIRNPEPLVHEEHDGIMFQPSETLTDPLIYIQGGQFEYDFSEEYRRVAD